MGEFNIKVGTDSKYRALFSYVWINKPQPADEEGQEPKYSASIVLDKKDKAGKKALDRMIEACKEANMEKTFGGKIIESKFVYPLHDGDEKDEDNDGIYAGKWYMSARSKMKPGVCDINLDPIIEPSEIYSGMLGIASIDFYAYNFKGKKGIGVALNNIMKVKDGPSLGGTAKNAKDDFKDYKVKLEDIDDEDMYS